MMSKVLMLIGSLPCAFVSYGSLAAAESGWLSISGQPSTWHTEAAAFAVVRLIWRQAPEPFDTFRAQACEPPCFLAEVQFIVELGRVGFAPQLGVTFYRAIGAKGEAASCACCGEPFASRMHVEDLKQVERELGIRYESIRLPAPSAVEGKADTADHSTTHYQDVCPACRRRNLALTQDALWMRGA